MSRGVKPMPRMLMRASFCLKRLPSASSLRTIVGCRGYDLLA